MKNNTATYKTVNVQIPIASTSEYNDGPGQKSSSSNHRNILQGLISKTAKDYSVEIASSLDLTTSTLSVVIRGLSEKADNARALLLRKISPTIALYLFAESSLSPCVYRKPPPPDDSDVQIITYNNGDTFSSFSFYKSGAITNDMLLCKVEHPAFSPPKSPFDKKILFILKGSKECLETRWKHIYTFSEEINPYKFVQINIDRTLIHFLSISVHSLLQLSASCKSYIPINNGSILVTVPPIFPQNSDFTTSISLYGLKDDIDTIATSLNDSISQITQSSSIHNLVYDKHLHRIISGNNCDNIHKILESTGVAVVFPPFIDDNNTITLRAKSSDDFEKAKNLINKIVLDTKTRIYDINISSIGLKITYNFEYIFEFLKFCKTSKLKAFEKKHNCKIFKFSTGNNENYWNNILSVECDEKESNHVLTELTKFIKISISNVLFIPVNLPSFFFSEYKHDFSSPQSHFISPNDVSENAPVSSFLGIIVPNQKKPIDSSSCSFESTYENDTTFKSPNFSHKVCIVIKHLNADELFNFTDIRKILSNDTVFNTLYQLFAAIKSTKSLQIIFYNIPTAIDFKHYPTIMSSSVVPLLNHCSVPYSLEYPGIDYATFDFVLDSKSKKIQLQISTSPCIVICVEKNRSPNIKCDLDFLFTSWLNTTNLRTFSNTVRFQENTPYLTLFIRPKKREAEVNKIIELACESLTFSDDYSKFISDNPNSNISLNIFLAMKKKQFFHGFYIHPLRSHPTPTTTTINQKSRQIQQNTYGPQSESTGLVINGFRETVDVVSEILKKRMVEFSESTHVVVPVLPKLTVSSKKTIEAHPKGLVVLNRTLFGASSNVRKIMLEVQKDGVLKIGFSKRGNPALDSKLSTLPDDAYIFWASKNIPIVKSIIDNVFKAVNEQIINSYVVQFSVPKLSSNYVMWYYTQEIAKLKKDFGVTITTYRYSSPETENPTEKDNNSLNNASNLVCVKIEGNKKSVDSAKELFIKIRNKCSSHCVRKVYIPYYMRSFLIKQKGDKINKIIEKLGGGGVVSISLAPDPINANINNKKSYNCDTVSISSFEDVFHDIFSSLIETISIKKSANYNKLLTNTISIENFNNIKDIPGELHSLRVVLPSGLNHSYYSVISANFKTYAQSLENAIIRTTLLPETLHDEVKFDGFNELKSDLLEIEGSSLVESLHKLFIPPVEFTIISSNQSILPHIEKKLIELSLIYHTYKIDAKNAQYIRFNKENNAFLPYVDYITSSISELDNHLHLGFAIISPPEISSIRICFCTLPKWKVELNSVLDKIFNNLQNLNNFSAFIINVSDFYIHNENTRDAQHPDSLRNCSNRVLSKVRRALESDPKNSDIISFSLNNCTEEFMDIISINFYLNIPTNDDLDRVSLIIKSVILQNMDDESFSHSKVISRVDSKLNVIAISTVVSDFSSNLLNSNEVSTPSNVIDSTKDTSYSNSANTQTLLTDTSQKLIIDLLPFTNNDPSVSYIPEIASRSVDAPLSKGVAISNKKSGPSSVKNTQETKIDPVKKSQTKTTTNKVPKISPPTKINKDDTSNLNNESRKPTQYNKTTTTPVHDTSNFITKGAGKHKVSLKYKEIQTNQHPTSKVKLHSYEPANIPSSTCISQSEEDVDDSCGNGIIEKFSDFAESVKSVEEELLEEEEIDEILEYDVDEEIVVDDNDNVDDHTDSSGKNLSPSLHSNNFVYDYDSLSNYSDDSGVEYLSPRSFISRSISSSSLVVDDTPDGVKDHNYSGNDISESYANAKKEEVPSNKKPHVISTKPFKKTYDDPSPSKYEWKEVGRSNFNNREQISNQNVKKTPRKKKGPNDANIGNQVAEGTSDNNTVSKSSSNNKKKKKKSKSKANSAA